MSGTTTDATQQASLVRSSGVMAAGTALSRITGFLRTVVLAGAIGTAALGDAYNVSHSIPTILYVLLAGGVLNAVFVPQLVRAMKEQPDGGTGYADRLLTLSGLVLLGITVAATLAAPLVTAVYVRGWAPADFAVAVAFTYWALPQIFFYGVFLILGQVLNVRGSFGPMMWAPILNNLVTIACGMLFITLASGINEDDPTSIPGWGIALLAGGSTLGMVVQTVALLPALRRAGYRFTPRRDFRGFGLGRAAHLAKWTLLFVAVNQLGYVVVANIGTAVTDAAEDVVSYGVGFTAYQYAYMIFQLPHGIATVSVVTALLPRMSRAAVEGRVEDVRRDLAGGLRLSAVVIVPAAVAFLVLGREIGQVLYGSAGAASARYIGLVLTAFAPGLLAFTGHYLALRGFYAQEDTRTPFLVNVVITGVNVVLVLLAYAVVPVQWVTVAMAGSYSLSYVVGMSLSLRLLRRRLGGLDGRRTVQAYGRLLVAALVAGAPAYVTARLLTDALGAGLPGSLAAVAGGGLVLLAGYLVLARLMRVAELTSLLDLVRARAAR